MARQGRKKTAGTSSTATPVKAGGFAYYAGTLAGLGFALVVLALLLYSPLTKHPFLNYDDGTYITANPNIQQGVNGETLRWATTHFYAANWHPLTWMVHALDYSLYGPDAAGHHFTSMLLHALNALLVFLLLARATKSVGRSFVVAAIFAVHPLNVESVAWAAELKNVLCTFFFLLAMGAYGWYARRPSILRYGSVAALFVLGLASKPMVITLPFVLLLVDFWPLQRVEKWSEANAAFPVPQRGLGWLIAEKLPLLLLSAGSAWLTVLGQRAAEATTMVQVGLQARLANALYSYFLYAWKALVPTGLAPFYPFPRGAMAAWQPLLGVFIVVSVSTLVWRFGPEHRYLVTGWLWYLGTLVPVIGLLQVGAQSHADRYTYIPLIGLLVMVVWAVSEFAERRKLSASLQMGAAGAAIAIYAVVAWVQLSRWESNYELWTHTIAVTGDNAVAEHNMSIDLIRSKQIEEAFPHLQRAVQLDPADLVSRLNLGNVYSSREQYAEALREYEQVLKQSKDTKLLLPAYVNAGSAYRKTKDYARAEAAYRGALQIDPGQPAALQGLELTQRDALLAGAAKP